MEEKKYEYIVEKIQNSVNKKIPVDNVFLKDTIEKLLDDLNLSTYVNKIENMDTMNGLKYFPFTKEIRYYLPSIEKQTIIPAHLDPFDQLFYQYLQSTRYILKTLQHIKQWNNLEKGTLENQIIQLCYKKYRNSLKSRNSFLIPDTTKSKMEFETLNEMYCTISPLENFPKIASYWDIVAIAELLERNQLANTEMLELCSILRKPYFSFTEIMNKKIPPTIYFLEMWGYKESQIKKLQKKSKDLDVVERLKLGLQLSDKELLRVKEFEKELQRDLKLPIK